MLQHPYNISVSIYVPLLPPFQLPRPVLHTFPASAGPVHMQHQLFCRSVNQYGVPCWQAINTIRLSPAFLTFSRWHLWVTFCTVLTVLTKASQRLSFLIRIFRLNTFAERSKTTVWVCRKYAETRLSTDTHHKCRLFQLGEKVAVFLDAYRLDYLLCIFRLLATIFWFPNNHMSLFDLLSMFSLQRHKLRLRVAFHCLQYDHITS